MKVVLSFSIEFTERAHAEAVARALMRHVNEEQAARRGHEGTADACLQ